MAHLGLDIGTTGIALAVIDKEPERVLAAYSREHQAGISSGSSRRLDVERVQRLALEMIGRAVQDIAPAVVESVGVTGQMHGFVLIDDAGQPLSLAWTWQDATVLDEAPGGGSWLDVFLQACGGASRFVGTGTVPAAGYAGPMLYRLAREHLLPERAHAVSIPDAIVAWLTGEVGAVGRSTSASFGLVDLASGTWDEGLLDGAAIPKSLLGRVTEREIVGRVGSQRLPAIEGVPVACALGDNQASFLGSVSDLAGTCLVNVGTGSQVSCATRRSVLDGRRETRPLWGDWVLEVEASLSGGTSFAVMANMFRDVCARMGCAMLDDPLQMMQALAKEAPLDAGGLVLVPAFDGERAQPMARGSLQGMSSDNLTAPNLCRALVEGVALQLVDMLDTLPLAEVRQLVSGGNALSRNSLLVKAVERCSGLSLRSVPYNEVAAVGAALYGAAALGDWTLAQVTGWVSSACCGMSSA